MFYNYTNTIFNTKKAVSRFALPKQSFRLSTNHKKGEKTIT